MEACLPLVGACCGGRGAEEAACPVESIVKAVFLCGRGCSTLEGTEKLEYMYYLYGYFPQDNLTYNLRP